MSRSRDQKPPTPAGVRVIVRDRPQPEPKREPEPPPMGPDAVIVPENVSPEALRAILDSLCKEHFDYITSLLSGRRDLQEASVKDVRQRALFVLMKHVRERKPIGHVRRFLTGVVHNVLLEHKREKMPIDPGAEVDEVCASTTDPEGKTTRAELRARMGVYVSRLPPEQAEVVRVMDFLGMTIQQAHVALGRPPSTISWQHHRAWEALEEMAQASERGAALAEKPGK